MVAPQHCLDTCQQLSYTKRLGQVVIRPLVQRGYLVGFFAKRCEDDDWHSAVLANSPANLQAVHARHHDIQNDQREIGPFIQVQRLQAIVGQRDFKGA